MNEVNGIASAVHRRKFCPKCGRPIERMYFRSKEYIDYYEYYCENCFYVIVQGEFREKGKCI